MSTFDDPGLFAAQNATEMSEARKIALVVGINNSLELLGNPLAVMLAYLNFYDQRGAGVETSFKGDKQGLGLTKRNKKRLAAQQMLMLLGNLAHNVVVWALRWLAVPQLRCYGIQRMVGDIFHLSGLLCCDASGQVL